MHNSFCSTESPISLPLPLLLSYTLFYFSFTPCGALMCIQQAKHVSAEADAWLKPQTVLCTRKRSPIDTRFACKASLTLSEKTFTSMACNVTRKKKESRYCLEPRLLRISKEDLLSTRMLLYAVLRCWEWEKFWKARTAQSVLSSSVVLKRLTLVLPVRMDLDLNLQYKS